MLCFSLSRLPQPKPQPRPRLRHPAMSAPHFELDDLVRVRGRSDLAFVARVAGADSDTESLASEDASSDGDGADERGRLTRWVEGLPGVSSLGGTSRSRPDGTPLISTYDDDDTPGDDGPDALSESGSDKPGNNELAEGCAQVIMAATGRKVVHKMDDLELLDRSLEPGMLAAWVDDEEEGEPVRQSGVVERVRKTVVVRRVSDITPATVTNVDPSTTFEVPTERLGFFSGIRAGDTIVSGSWVGIIEHFQEDVYVEFSNGAIACMPGHRKALQNVDERTPDRERPDPFAEGLYYPGQKVRSMPAVWQTIATWIRGIYSGEDEGIVKSVSLGDVGVEWAAKSMFADPSDESRKEPGIQVVKYSEVTLLEGFRALWWSVGDRAFLLEPQYAHQSAREDSMSLEGGHQAPSKEAEEEVEVVDGNDSEDGAWEEDPVLDHSSPGPSPSPSPVTRPKKKRYKGQGGRLMEAQRRARERNAGGANVATVSDASVANMSTKPEEVVQVVGTRSTADVVWQDGSKSSSVPTTKLRMIHHPDPYDFWPGTVVLKTDEDVVVPEKDGAEVKKPSMFDVKKGAVVKVNQNDRTALVKWQKEPGAAFEAEEEMSVYDLKPAEFEVDVGETVLRVPQCDVPQENPKEWVGVILKQEMGQCTVAWVGGKVSAIPTQELLYITGGDDESFEEMEQYSMNEGSEQLIPGLAGGFHPRDEHAAYEDEQNSPNFHPNWGTDDELGDAIDDSEFASSFTAGKETIRRLLSTSSIRECYRAGDWINYATVIEKVATEVSAKLSLRRLMADGSLRRLEISIDEERSTASGFVFEVLGHLLLQYQRERNADGSSEVPSESAINEEWEGFVNAAVSTFSRIMKREANWHSKQFAAMSGKEDIELTEQTTPSQDDSGDQKDMEVTSDHVVKSGEADTEGPQNFQVLPELDVFHSFPEVPSDAKHSIGFLTVVHKEWSHLRKSLPPGMIVRACEATAGKFRAGIVGPEGTPYADVIFFFDILLGPKYPNMPPHVWFHSHGRRLNPNLYDDGRVCLSILGTWDGDDVESWNAKTSNLLRVLLSLQALVFVEEPYYNEAGYGKQRGTKEGQTNSRMYNESAFLLSMKYILQSLKKGNLPEDCADIAERHYRRMGPKIRQRCRELAERTTWQPKDPNTANGHAGQQDQQPYSSAGFKRSLKQLLEPLESALTTTEGGS